MVGAIKGKFCADCIAAALAREPAFGVALARDLLKIRGPHDY